MAKGFFHRVLAALFVAAAALLPWSAHAGVDDFSFSSFHADYTLSRDDQRISRLHVVERLEAVFPDFDQNHGILRAIPQTYDGHSVHLKVASVTDEVGNDIRYSTSSSNKNLVLKIGDADKYVHGQKTYIITYDMDNVTAKPAGNDGLFWDVNGDQWPQAFKTVSATITIDPSLSSSRITANDRCFTGARGSQAQNCTVQTDGYVVNVSTATALAANETLTYELGFKEGTFAAYTIPKAELITLAAKIFFLLLLPIAITLWFTLRRWWRYGRDPAGRGIVIAEYVPPKDLSVLGSSAVLHEGFRPSAITATILDLAVRRYVKIYETKTKIPILPDKITYELELTKSPDGLKDEEQRVVKMLFGTSPAVGDRKDISSLTNKLYQQAASLGKDVNQTVATGGYFAINPEKAKLTFYVIGGVVAASSFLFMWQLFLMAGLLTSGLILLAAAHTMPARTAKGVEARDTLLGLKLFITVAESERIKAMQSPRGGLTEKIDVTDQTQVVKVYELLLPYAMLFGIEKDWIKEFTSLYKEPPDWYHGSGAFNAAYFAGAMSSFATASNAGFTPPSSSGSGGSAGGGGGGGGGGGW